ncbi:PREDICTED: caspase-8 [Drosophila arizonae]|uniref:Caspase-8 n=1 Tax=Drosophila arizonae TaxID=7263 RepID=A0ABM1PWU1_DROAR|nr:PREDICTED: caspase-8 [Drosophila arizonae]
MQTQLDNLHLDDLPYIERDLNLSQKVSLAFLLFGDQHALATYILQRLLALMRAPPADQLHSDLLRQYAQTNPANWRGHLVEALCIINARQVLRKLGFCWAELHLHYLPHVLELTLHVHPLLKALYNVCEQLTVAQSGRLVLDINDKLARRRTSGEHDEPLRFYDYSYLEIFLLDWLTRHHLRLGDIDAIGSDVQLLIEYFKFNDLNSLATLLIQTVNTSANESSSHSPVNKYNTDDLESTPVALSAGGAAPFLAETSGPTPCTAPAAPSSSISRHRRSNALQVHRDRAGILLIINQQNFHRNVSEKLMTFLPTQKLTQRNGTNADKQRLIDVFSPLGYEVEAHDNVDHLKMIALIRGACARSVLRDSLIVCILSHGFEGAVYGADSIPLSIEDVKKVLCADESLHDKPKMLFIQACQQNEKQLKTRNVNATTQSASQLANMVVAMSTVPGFVALRHSVQGSWFIQTLCDTVQKHAKSDHILDILTLAAGQVIEKRGDKDQKMVPIVINTLTKNVYLSEAA